MSLRPNQHTFLNLLRAMDPEAMAQHSTLDHHVEGMHYLCLHRSEELTLKVYLIEKPTNPNGGFLVYPHSHRYAFNTVVLAGMVDHLLFTHAGALAPHDFGGFLHRNRANARQLEDLDEYLWVTRTQKTYRPGQEYFVDIEHMHTLVTYQDCGPLMLGLTQMEDEVSTSDILLPVEVARGGQPLLVPESRRPTPAELHALRERCVALLLSNY